jgi:glycosyltransferase involved in cell wall biosynthesis
MPQENTDIWIVIPAYNEVSSIGPVIKDLRTGGYDNILVVDDGSKDDTATVASNAGAIVLKHLINRGQGAALRTGIHFVAEQHKPRVIVTFDADGQHIASDIPRLAAPILSGDFDIVLGSRFLESKSTIPILRKLVLRCGVVFTNIISRIRLTDTHNGLRALGERAYDLIEIQHRGMEHASEIIDEISRHQLRYTECPVTIIYSDYSQQKGQRTSNFIRIAVKIILKKLL